MMTRRERRLERRWMDMSRTTMTTQDITPSMPIMRLMDILTVLSILAKLLAKPLTLKNIKYVAHH